MKQRTRCETYILINLNVNGKYFILVFNDKHNHLFASSDKANVLRSQRKISVAQVALVEECDKLGIKPKSTYDLLSRLARVFKILEFL